MDRQRGSSSDQNQCREGRQERRDQTWFLKPERSHSAPPNLEKNRLQAAKDTFETLETQGAQLIHDFNHFLKGLQPNIENKSLISKEQFNTYKDLVQSYTIYKGSQFAFDITEHNNYLTTGYLDKLRLNDNRLDHLRIESFNTIKSINDFGTIDFFNEYSQGFIDKSKSRIDLIKDMNSFFNDIKVNKTYKSSLSKEQVRTYENLIDRSRNIFVDFEDFKLKEFYYEDYCNENQKLQVRKEVQFIRNIGDNLDSAVQSIRVAHPTFTDLRSQRDIIGKRWYALQSSCEHKKQIDFSLSKYEHERNEFHKIIQLIKDYEIATKAFNNTEHAIYLKKYQKTCLQLDQTRVQEYKAAIERFLASQKESD